jgi:hypothetical protein
MYKAGGAGILVPIGYNYGNVSLQVAGDLDEDAANGANGSRHIIRCGNGGSKSPDGDPLQSGEYDEDYLQEYFDDAFDRPNWYRSLAADSNCFYNIKPDNELCIWEGSLGNSIFNNANLLAAFLDRWTQVSERWEGKFLFFEPCVEPAPGIASVTADQIKDRQEMVMDIVWSRPANAHAFALIGGRAYGYGNASGAYRVAGGGKEGWATRYPNKIVLTGNFLAGALKTNFRSVKFPALVAAGDLHNVPIFPQQVGIERFDDPTGALLADGFDACRETGIGLFEWEKIASTPDTHGSWYMSGGSRVIQQDRADLVHAKFAASAALYG